MRQHGRPRDRQLYPPSARGRRPPASPSSRCAALRRRRFLDDLSFELRAGEILGHRRADRRRPQRDRQGASAGFRPQRRRRLSLTASRCRSGHYRDSDRRRRSSISRRTARATASSSTCRSPQNISALDLKRVSAPVHGPQGPRGSARPKRLARAARHSAAAASTSRSRRSRAATSRRWRIAKLLCGQPAGASSSTSRRAASMSAPRREIHRILRDLARQGVGIVVDLLGTARADRPLRPRAGACARAGSPARSRATR